MNALEAPAAADAVAWFAEVWSDTYLLCDISNKLTCTEAEALAGMLRHLGCGESAAMLIDSHAEGDDEGDDHYTGPVSE